MATINNPELRPLMASVSRSLTPSGARRVDEAVGAVSRELDKYGPEAGIVLMEVVVIIAGCCSMIEAFGARDAQYGLGIVKSIVQEQIEALGVVIADAQAVPPKPGSTDEHKAILTRIGLKAFSPGRA